MIDYYYNFFFRLANHANVQSTFGKQTPLLPSPPAPTNPLKVGPKGSENAASNFISSNLNSLSLNLKMGQTSDKNSETNSALNATPNMTAIQPHNWRPPFVSQSVSNFQPYQSSINSPHAFHSQPMGMTQSTSFSTNPTNMNAFGIRPPIQSTLLSPTMGVGAWSNSNATLKPLSSSDINEFLS